MRYEMNICKIYISHGMLKSEEYYDLIPTRMQLVAHWGHKRKRLPT